MTKITVTNEESLVIDGVRLIREVAFNDQNLQAEIKKDYFYLLRFIELVMDRIPPESLGKDDSLGETLVRQFIIEVNQLTGKLSEIAHDCETESAIEEAEEIVKDGDINV